MWTSLRRVLYVEVPRPVVWLYAGALCALVVFVSVHTPVTLYPGAPHDDGLYMSLGRYLSEGSWLGPYNEFTLAKGPGYPAFLAVANWLGISVSLAHALFQCFAALFFVVVCHRFVKSTLLSGLMLTLLVWQPIPIAVYLRRILREQIYYPQLLLFLGLLILVLFASHENQEALAVRHRMRAGLGLVLAHPRGRLLGVARRRFVVLLGAASGLPVPVASPDARCAIGGSGFVCRNANGLSHDQLARLRLVCRRRFQGSEFSESAGRDS